MRHAAAIPTVLATAITLLGCAAVAPRPPRATAPPVRGRPARTQGPAPSRWIRLGALGEPRVVERGAVARLVAGGYRIERGADGAVRGGEGLPLAEPIVAALRGVAPAGSAEPASWRFVTAHGLYDAASFSAPLRAVRETTEPGARVGAGTGRAVVVLRGALEGAPRPPGPGAVIDAAFADAQRGVAVVEPGCAFATEDGGASWRAIALAGDAARAVVASATARWVLGEEAAAEIDADGAAREVPLERAPRLLPSLDAADTAASDEVVARDPTRALAVALSAGVLTDDGHAQRALVSIARARDGASELVAFDLARDELRALAAMPARAALVRAGDALFAVSTAPSGATTLLEYAPGSTPGEWRPRVSALADGPLAGQCVVSADGARAACGGACGGGARGARAVYCERARDADAPVEREAPAGATRLLGYDGDAPVALVRRDDAPDGDTAPASFALARGNDAPVSLLDAAAPAGLRFAGATPDVRLEAAGRVRARVATRDGAPGVLAGRPGSSLVFLPAPTGSTHVAFGAPGVVMARGDDALWQSDDDGATWAPLPVHDADAALVRAEIDAAARAPASSVPSPQCGPAGCVFDSRAARVGFGPVRASGSSALGPAMRAVEPPPGDPFAGDTTAPEVDCEVAGAPLRVPALATPPAVAGEAVFVDTSLDGATLVVRERAAARAGGALRVEASWRAAGTRPDAGDTTARFALERYFAPAGDDAERAGTRWRAVALTPRRALAVRCGAGPAGVAPRCELFALEPSTTNARALAALPLAPRRMITARAPDGAVALLALPSPPRAADEADPMALTVALAAVARDGASARAARVALARGAPPRRALGAYVLDADDVGVAAYDLGRGELALMPAAAPADGAARAFAAPLRSDVCGAAARGEVALALRGVLHVRDGGTRPLAVTGRFGRAADGLCLRALEGEVVQLGAWGAFTAAPGIDGVTGVARLREGMVPLRCRLAPR